MGRDPLVAEMIIVLTQAVHMELASMGRRPVSRGNHLDVLNPEIRSLSSMGPR